MRIKLELILMQIARAEESIQAGKMPDAMGYLRGARKDAEEALARCHHDPEADAALDRLVSAMLVDLEPEMAEILKPKQHAPCGECWLKHNTPVCRCGADSGIAHSRSEG